jgi:hypothetical protein
MIQLIIILVVLVLLIWYLGLRAAAIYGAYLGGSLAHSFGLHWITIGLCAIAGSGAIYAIILILSAMSKKRSWLVVILFALVCIPAFLVGFGIIQDFMGDGRKIESAIVGALAGLMMAAASFSAYQRDIANAL